MPSTLETIGREAFASCPLTSVFIPKNVSEIGYWAFAFCKLSEFEIDLNNNYFSVEDGILFNKDKSTLVAYPCGKEGVEYNVPENVTSIELAAFRGNPSLTTVNIPSSVVSIGVDAFYNCASMTAINVASGNPQYISDGGIVFSRDKSTLHFYPTANSSTAYNVPDGVTVIGKHAFNSNQNLVSVNLPNGLTSIGYCAFAGCRSLASLYVPETVNYIGGAAFQLCTSLGKVNIPEGVTSIETYTFSLCPSLKSITLPESITKIGDRAFMGCGITSLLLPKNVTDIGSYAFLESRITELISLATTPPATHDFGLGLATDKVILYVPAEAMQAYKSTKPWYYFLNIADVANYSYGEVGDISPYETSFDEENNIVIDGYNGDDEDIVIPAYAYVDGAKRKVAKIGDKAFYSLGQNSNITSCVIPSTVTAIGDEAFAYCSSLKSVTFDTSNSNSNNAPAVSQTQKRSSEGVVSIGEYAFYMSGLEEISIPSTVANIDLAAFICDNLKDINVSEDNEYYSSIDGMLYNKEKTELILCPRKTALTELSIPNGVSVIASSAIHDCKGLLSINIPASVTKIVGIRHRFSGCTNLRSVNVKEDNENYSSVNGVLYNGETTELLECPMGYPYEELIIPEGVKKIGNYIQFYTSSIFL